MTTASEKRVAKKRIRLIHLNPKVRIQIPVLPAKDGKLALDRKNSDHVAWMQEW